MSTPSIAALSKSAHQALADVETQANAQVARATADLRDARIERDNAINALHTSQLEAQTWKQEVASCKAALKQADLTIVHQTDTIAQLRREANQWRDQSRNWQDHFLRVEQERCGLTTRIEELVSESLQRNQAVSTPFTIDSLEPASSVTQRASSSSHPPAYKSAPPVTPDDRSPPTSISASKSGRSLRKPLKRPHPPLPPPAEPPAYQPQKPHSVQTPRKRKSRSPLRTESRVIRRVQAVIHVKQEESDEDSAASDLRSEKRAQEHAHVKSTKPIRHRKTTIPLNDDEVESTRGASIPGTTLKAVDHFSEDEEDSDDQDELMLVAEDNYYDILPPPTRTSKKSLLPPGEPSSMPPNKKRKAPLRRKA